MLITPQFLEDPDTRAPLTRLGTGRIFDRREWLPIWSAVTGETDD